MKLENIEKEVENKKCHKTLSLEKNKNEKLKNEYWIQKLKINRWISKWVNKIKVINKSNSRNKNYGWEKNKVKKGDIFFFLIL